MGHALALVYLPDLVWVPAMLPGLLQWGSLKSSEEKLVILTSDG
jgi:hypothetical protein